MRSSEAPATSSTGLVVGAELPRLDFPGTRRGRAPAETLQLLGPFSKVAGITRVGVVSGLDVCPLSVVMVVRPLSASVSVTQGKGLTLDCAKVSGMMEAVEHFHAETIEGRLRLASERELERHSRVSTERLPGLQAHHSPHRRILWQLGEPLTSRGEAWVPFDLVHLDLRAQGATGVPSFVPNSNGLASGNCREEAIVHALYEVIERHVTAEFYDLAPEEQEQRRLVNAAITDAVCRELIAALARVGVDVALWDLSNRLEVPAFFCEILSSDDPYRSVPVARGFGCHGEAGVALARALCEAVQSRLTIIAGARDDMEGLAPEERKARAAQTQLQWGLRSRSAPRRLFRAIASRRFGSFSEELGWLVAQLTCHGFDEPILVDLSKPGWPVSVVRVLVPGLRFEPSESMSRDAAAESSRERAFRS